MGEPPLFIGSSVYFAIMEAIKAARKENGHSTEFFYPAPATSARIRMLCEDKFTKLVCFLNIFIKKINLKQYIVVD